MKSHTQSKHAEVNERWIKSLISVLGEFLLRAASITSSRFPYFISHITIIEVFLSHLRGYFIRFKPVYLTPCNGRPCMKASPKFTDIFQSSTFLAPPTPNLDPSMPHLLRQIGSSSSRRKTWCSWRSDFQHRRVQRGASLRCCAQPT